MNFQVGIWVNVTGYVKELKEWKTRTKNNEQYHGVMLVLADGQTIKAWVKTPVPLFLGQTLSLNGKVSEYDNKIYLDYCSFAPTAAPVPPLVQNYPPKPPEGLGAAMPPQVQPPPPHQPTRFPDPEILRMAEAEVKAKQEAENKARYEELERQKVRSINTSYAAPQITKLIELGVMKFTTLDQYANDVSFLADKWRIYVTSGLWNPANAEPEAPEEADDIPF